MPDIDDLSAFEGVSPDTSPEGIGTDIPFTPPLTNAGGFFDSLLGGLGSVGAGLGAGLGSFGNWLGRSFGGPGMGANLLGLLGGGANLAGLLAGGGQGPRQTPTLPVPARAAIEGFQAQALPFVTGQTPLQTQQASLLSALAGGQGLPPGYQRLIEQAFQPALGDLYQQAVRAGQGRGFYDAPATSPVGGAVLGPGLAALQGQMAQAKLGLMQSLPQLFNQPIQSQMGALGALGRIPGMYGVGQQQSQPLGPQVGQTIGSALGGIGTGLQQQQQWQALMRSLSPSQAGPPASDQGLSNPLGQGGLGIPSFQLSPSQWPQGY